EGKHGLAPLFGLELAYPVLPWLSPFVRGVAGPIVELPSNYMLSTISPTLISAQVGAPARYIEVFAAMGSGPGRGFNIGVGASLVLAFGVATEGGAGSGEGAEGFVL